MSLVRSATLLPLSAAVGLRALAHPDRGAVAGTGLETDLADRVLLTDAVEAELLSRNRRSPGGSGRVVVELGPATGPSGRKVEAWEEALDNLDEEADVLTLPASESDMTRDVVRGNPAGGATPRRFRTTGEMAEGPRRSSIETSISAGSAPLLRRATDCDADLPSLISFNTQCSRSWNPPASRICIHRRRTWASTPSLATSICCRACVRGRRTGPRLMGSALRSIDETRT